jgi:hypothetical protein
MSRDVDDTKKRIGVSGLDDEQRKKLFKDFVDHGGKADAKQKSAKETVRRHPEAETAVKRRAPSHEKAATRGRTAPPPAPAAKHAIKKKKKGASIISAMRINIKGQLLKVWGFGGRRLKESFVTAVKKEIKDALIDIDLITGSMLRGNSSVQREIVRASVGENCFLHECIVRLNDIYDETEWADFQKLVSRRQIPKPSQALPVNNLFIKLYSLGQHRNLCRLHGYKAIEIQEKHSKVDSETTDRLKRGLGTKIDLILDDFLKQLHILLCRMEGKYLILYSQKLDDYLRLTEKDKMGYITRIEKKRRIEALKEAKESLRKAQEPAGSREREEIKIPKHVQRGLSIVEDAVRSYEHEHTGTEAPLQGLEEREKMYRTLVLLDIFDSQYSFVLTTSKIIYNIDYVEQKKVDIKEDLNHAYILFSEAREEAMDYLETVREVKNRGDDQRLTQYQQSSLIEKLEKKRHNLSRKSRKMVLRVMKHIEEILSTVINDYKGEKILLQNPEEYLRFDPNIDGHKKLDGRRAIEAIIETFLFTATFAFLLNYGDLSGPDMYVEEKTDTPLKQ